jgi:hypothetical protein
MCRSIEKSSEQRTRGRPRGGAPAPAPPYQTFFFRLTAVRLGSPDAASHPAHGRGLPPPIAAVRSRLAMPDRG